MGFGVAGLRSQGCSLCGGFLGINPRDILIRSGDRMSSVSDDHQGPVLISLSNSTCKPVDAHSQRPEAISLGIGRLL